MTITFVTSAILAIIYVLLAVYVIKNRYKHKVSINSNNVPQLDYAIRAHANFNEYVPLTLILLYLAEGQYGSIFCLQATAVAVILGRLCHAYAFITMNNRFKTRQMGMMLSFIPIIGLAIALIASII